MGALLFFKKYGLIIIIVAAVVALAYYVGSYKERGEKIITLTGVIKKLDSLITRKNDTLFVVRDQVSKLQGDTARLHDVISQQTITNLNLKAQLSAGERAALLTDQAIAAGKQQVNNLVDAMSNLEKKQAADAGLKDEDLSFEGPGTSVDDVEINDRIAKLTKYGKVYRDSTNQLKKVVGQQAEKIVQQEGTIKDKDDQLSALEKNLLHIHNTDADAIEAVVDKKRFLNIGLKQDARKTINEIRAGRARSNK